MLDALTPTLTGKAFDACMTFEARGDGGKTKEKEKERRRNAPGSDREDEDKKKDTRFQFRRTVSAPSLFIPKARKRLIQCVGKKRIHVRETDPIAGSLNYHDVYEH